jgi:hypothetical protein
MTHPGLTKPAPAARNLNMQVIGQGAGRSRRRAWGAAAVMVVTGSLVSGCISVNAPDKPIVIELNINIKQEVIYRLAEDVKQNIESNPEIF